MTRSLPLSSRDGKKRESNGHTLWGELKKQGYDGSERTVYRFLETLKQAQVKTVIEYERLQKFSASTAIWLCIREEDALDDLEQEDLKAWLDAHPTLARAFQLIQDFLVMVHQREGHRLDVWLQQVEVSTIPELHSFARCGWNGIKPLSRLG